MVQAWWGQRLMRCCGRLQPEVSPPPVQLPAPWQVAAAAGRTAGEFVAELIQQGGIHGGNALDL